MVTAHKSISVHVFYGVDSRLSCWRLAVRASSSGSCFIVWDSVKLCEGPPSGHPCLLKIKKYGVLRIKDVDSDNHRLSVQGVLLGKGPPDTLISLEVISTLGPWGPRGGWVHWRYRIFRELH